MSETTRTDTSQQVASRSIHRMKGLELSRGEDALAVEEPLEIRAAGDPVAVTMRTPGSDSELAVGFLYAEGIVRSRANVGSASHCGQPGSEGFGNTIDVLPAPGTAFDVDRVLTTRRGTLTTSACGVCGRQSIDDLLERCRPFPDGPEVAPSIVARVVSALRESQDAFELTGGLHGAAAFSSSGDLLTADEDVGRHNAIDKVVGRLLMEGRLEGGGEASPAILAGSGRASFEIIQKSAVAGMPIVIAVSAASSMAADLAGRLNMTLVGFVRGDGYNLYAGEHRLSNETTG